MDEIGIDDVVPAPPAVIDVTCQECGHDTQVRAHDVKGHEIRWQCDCAVSYYIDQAGAKQPTKESGLCECAASNIEPGTPGIPGEGALNPAASAVSHEDLVEAASRRMTEDELEEALAAKRGTIHDLHVGGGAAPSGEVHVP